MDIAFVLYDGFTALDLVGAYEVIAAWPEARPHFLATEQRPQRADNGLTVLPTATPASLAHPDVIVIPGSSRPLAPLDNQALLAWIRDAAPRARWCVSVCTGSSLYAAAGVLGAHPVTTHWAFRDILAGMGATVSTARVVIDPPFASAAGVSSGIDMALALTGRIHGEATARLIQLAIEYDPQPPFDAGSPEKAGPQLVGEALRLFSAALQPP
ncbi:DJ-1/PfpI family protein [bacterium]|nr:DJ-1/PfpI family protein [bacterium]